MCCASSCITAAGVPAGASASLVVTAGFGLEALGEDIGGLLRAQQRARDDVIEGDVERVERPGFLLQPLDPRARERPLRVVGIFVAALRRDAVANQIQLESRHTSAAPAQRRR